jgi:hypothetical protein
MKIEFTPNVDASIGAFEVFLNNSSIGIIQVGDPDP